MSLSVATGPKQYVFRRNYSTRTWESLPGDGKACRVQVIKRSGSGEHILRITPESGETREHKLSGENRVHFSEGFIQVPLADSKELYGIKFKDVIQGEEFYMRMVQSLGLPRSYPKTTIGDDGNPNPIGSSGAPPPQQAPMTIAGGQIPRAQILRASDPARPSPPPPQAGGVQVLPTNQSVKLPPSMQQQQQQQQRPLDPASFDQPQPQPRQRVATYGGEKAAAFQQYQQRQQQQQNLPNHVNHVSPEQGGFSLAAAQRQHQAPHQMFEHSGQQRVGGGGEGRGGFSGQPLASSAGQQQFVGGSKSVSRDQFDGPSPRQAPYGTGMRPGGGGGGGGGGMGMGPSGGSSGLGPGGGLQQLGRSPPKRRPPMSLAASDVQSVAESMVDAMNQGDEERSKHMFDILVRRMKEPDGGGRFALNFDNPSKTPPKLPSFTLYIQVEFQQPNKQPVPIFLYDVTADDSITVLAARVEQEFYIPKLSQNWIIGSRLVKGNDTNKPLKELGIEGDGVGEVNVFMYVMHTKKAQVPNEAARVRQQQHRQQQQQELQNIQRQRDTTGQGQQLGGQAAGGGGFQQPHGAHIQVMDEQATYSRLGNRGYAPQGQQPFEGADDPTYSRLDEFQRPGGDPQMINRGAPHNPNPNPNQLMMQQGRGGGGAGGVHVGGGGGMGMGQQQYDPQVPGYNAHGMQQYQQLPHQHQHQQSQHPMNTQSYLGVPQQLLVGQSPAAAQQQQQLQPPPPLQQQQPVAVAPAPPPQPPKPTEPPGWICPQCTLVNNPRRPGCELCSCARPEDYVVPDEAPLADFEKRAKENENLFERTWKKQAEEHYREMVNADNAELVTNPEPFECQICYLDVEAGEGIVLRDCLHQFCRECIKQSVMQSNEAEVKCPFNDKYECNAVISEREIRACVTEEELQAYHKRVVTQAESALPNSFHCKTPDCRGWCINEDEVNEFQCPVCGKTNCILCKANHEGMNCKEYQDDLKRKAENDEAAKATQDMLEKLVQNGEAMRCPQCKVIVQKKEGCDWIRCSMCKTEMCWATKGPRWGPNGRGDISGGCRCRVNGKKCHPLCRNCH